MRFLGAALLSCSILSFSAAAGTALLDDCSLKSSKWIFQNGAEFPGAEGSLKAVDGGLLLSYDFSKGGAYVAADRSLSVQGAPAEFKFDLSASSPAFCIFRLVDSTGRCFQTAQMPLPSGASSLSLKPAEAKWKDIWGGDNKSKTPAPPFKSVALCVDKDAAKPLQGSILLKGLSLSGDDFSVDGFKGDSAALSAVGWSVEGAWRGALDAPAFFIKATPSKDAKDATLSISLPAMGRSQCKRFSLDAAAGPAAALFEPALINGGSPFNIYAATLCLSSGDETASAVSRLRGSASSKINLGVPRSSLEIASLPFGTCAHFSYGQSGSFSGWRDYRKLIGMASACGFKWVRDGAYVERDATGALHVRPYDLEWIKYAKSKGISSIIVIEGFKADKSVEELKSEAAALCVELKGLVDVFELGNEPNNFGGWLKKYGGTWNGKEKDNSTSPWVFEHLKATNAVAKAMKAARPDATLIGIGACPPTNFRYLDIGVADELDGVTEHPYSFSMPPEKVPWSLKLEGRDGVKVGDEEGSFPGFIESYFKKFEQTGRKRSLWVTEFGFTSFRFNGKNEKGLYAGYSEEAQAAYLVRRFIQSLTLPISVSCQYDLIDDYGSNPATDEANFGILRSDFSPKPAYAAIQRMNSLFDSAKPDPSAVAKVEKSPLHRAMVRGELVKDWDNVEMKASNAVAAYAFASPLNPAERMLAVWSTQPYQNEFNCRSASVSISGWSEFASSPAIGIDLMTGASFDVPFAVKDGAIALDGLELGSNPIIVKFFKR